MSAGLPTQPASVFQARRAALSERMGGRASVVYSGLERPRNYAANVYPYRPDSHFLYLTGARLPGCALWIEGGESTLFAPARAPDDFVWHGALPSEGEVASALGVSRLRDYSELSDAIRAAGDGAVATLPAIDPLTRLGQARLHGRSWVEIERAPKLDGSDELLADSMIALRMVHDAAAIDRLRASAGGAVAAHRAGMAATRVGGLESQVRAAMEAELTARNMPTAYGSIVTVHGEILHNTTHDGGLEDGDLLLADVGGEYDGWSSDITRTWPVNGKFSATQRTMYEIVLQSQLDAIDKVRAGVRYRDVHLRAALTIAQGLVDEGILVGEPSGLVERGAHALFFTHGVGHLIGLDVHDMEDLGDLAGYASGRTRSEQFGLGFLRLDRDLCEGMAVTIEPGFYQVPGILAEGSEWTQPFDADGTLDRDALSRFADVRGIRIEDDVLCTAGDPEVMTGALCKSADEVEATVGTATGRG